jgi:hypothetical protein
MVRCGRIFRVHPAYTGKLSWILVKRVDQVAIVPLIVTYLNEYCTFNLILMHQLEQGFGGRIYLRDYRSRRKCVPWFTAPDVDVGID